MDFSWPMATLLGALLTVSGPTVILPLLRQVRPTRPRIGSIIKWEGIVNDPIGAVLAALVFELVAPRHRRAMHLAWESGRGCSLKTAAFVGFAARRRRGLGADPSYLLQRYLIPDYLQKPNRARSRGGARLRGVELDLRKSRASWR